MKDPADPLKDTEILGKTTRYQVARADASDLRGWIQDGPICPMLSAPLKAAIEGLHAKSVPECSASVLHHWSELVHHYVLRFAQPHSTYDRLSRVWQRVETDLARAWTLEELVAIACLSGKHLRRHCRKDLGRSPMQPLTHLRLQRARHLLSITDDKVDVIARAVGFESAFTFSNTFNNRIGWWPSEFRH